MTCTPDSVASAGNNSGEEPQPAEPLIPPLRKLRTKILFALALFLALVAFALARL